MHVSFILSHRYMRSCQPSALQCSTYASYSSLCRYPCHFLFPHLAPCSVSFLLSLRSAHHVSPKKRCWTPWARQWKVWSWVLLHAPPCLEPYLAIIDALKNSYVLSLSTLSRPPFGRFSLIVKLGLTVSSRMVFRISNPLEKSSQLRLANYYHSSPQ